MFAALSPDDQQLMTGAATEVSADRGRRFPTLRGFIGTFTGRCRSESVSAKKRSAEESDVSDGDDFDISPCTYCSSDSSLSVQPQAADATRRSRAKQTHGCNSSEDDSSTSYLDHEFARMCDDYVRNAPFAAQDHGDIDLRLAELADEDDVIEFDPDELVH